MDKLILFSPPPDPKIQDSQQPWFPGFNDGTDRYDPYLDAILMNIEASAANGDKLKLLDSEDAVGDARLTFLYRSPRSPAEEQFCRGQF